MDLAGAPGNRWVVLTRVLMVLAALTSLLGADPGPAPSPSGQPAQRQVPSKVESVAPAQAVAVLGREVAAPNGETIGRLVDVLVNGNGAPQAAVIDFGGFMGVGARKIAVDWRVLHFEPADSAHPITLELTPQQIAAAPEYKDPNKPAPVVAPATPSPPSPASR